jgi:hypothetical protein
MEMETVGSPASPFLGGANEFNNTFDCLYMFSTELESLSSFMPIIFMSAIRHAAA